MFYIFKTWQFAIVETTVEFCYVKIGLPVLEILVLNLVIFNLLYSSLLKICYVEISCSQSNFVVPNIQIHLNCVCYMQIINYIN